MPFFAPCLMHTPPLTAMFLHPSLLHRLYLIFAPCLTHTPPLTAMFVHPSVEHIFAYFFHLVGAGLLITSEDWCFLFDDDDVPLLLVTASADCVGVVRKIGADLFRVENRRRYEVEVVDRSVLFL